MHAIYTLCDVLATVSHHSHEFNPVGTDCGLRPNNWNPGRVLVR